MCGFTLLAYSECGHEVLSIKPEHTNLCRFARMTSSLHLQGVDCAPAACAPNSDENTVLATTHHIYDYCDECRSAARAEQNLLRGELDDVLQVDVNATDEIGTFERDEAVQVADLRCYVQQKVAEGMELAEKVEDFIITNPETLTRITFLWQKGPEKYQSMYLAGFQQCAYMVTVLEIYIQQRVANQIFVDTYKFAHDKARGIASIVSIFEVVADGLINFEASRPEERWNGSEARLEYFFDVLLRSVTGAGPHVAPEGSYMYDANEKIPEDVRKKIEEEEAAFQFRLFTPVERREQKEPRMRNGTLNIHKLEFDPESLKVLLGDELAVDIEGEIVGVPEGENGMGVDVEDEQRD